MKLKHSLIALIILTCVSSTIYLSLTHSELFLPIFYLSIFCMVFLPPLVMYFDFEMSGSSSRIISLLSVLIAVNVASRQLMHGFGPSPIFFLVILTGFVFGPMPGYIMGSFTIIVSNFFIGGHGPWSIMQISGLGLIGFFSSLIPKTKNNSLWPLIIFGFFSGIFYGLYTDIFSWIFFTSEKTLSSYLGVAFSGLGFSLTYALSNLVFLAILGKPVMKIMGRFKNRLQITYIK